VSMTTLVALATKDSIVMGCDSLGTVSKPLLDPFRLLEFFDSDNDFNLRLDESGEPELKDFSLILDQTESVPYNHMTDVDKLIDLSPVPLGVMSTGITSIGDRTIKSLIGEFRDSDQAFKKSTTNYTVKTIAGRLAKHIERAYVRQYPKNGFSHPELELILGGYGKSHQLPSICRVTFPNSEETFHKPGVFGIVFGGQMREIQRLVFGTDGHNKERLERRYLQLIKGYTKELQRLNENLKLPDIAEYLLKNHIFGMSDPDDPNSDSWDLFGLDANWGDFSEQNAIDLRHPLKAGPGICENSHNP